MLICNKKTLTLTVKNITDKSKKNSHQNCTTLAKFLNTLSHNNSINKNKKVNYIQVYYCITLF